MHRRPTQSTGTFTRALLPPSRTIRSIIENPSTFTSIGVAMYAQCMHQLYIVLTCILGMHSVCTGGDGIETYYSVDRRGRGNAFDVVRQSGWGKVWLGRFRWGQAVEARRGAARLGADRQLWQGPARLVGHGRGAAVLVGHGSARLGMVGHGAAVRARRGAAWRGSARVGSHGLAW